MIRADRRRSNGVNACACQLLHFGFIVTPLCFKKRTPLFLDQADKSVCHPLCLPKNSDAIRSARVLYHSKPFRVTGFFANRLEFLIDNRQ